MESQKTYEDIFGTIDTIPFKKNIPDASSGDGILRTAEQMKEWIAPSDTF